MDNKNDNNGTNRPAESTLDLCVYYNTAVKIEEVVANERSLAESRYRTNANRFNTTGNTQLKELLDEFNDAKCKYELVKTIEKELMARILNNLKKEYAPDA